MAQWLLRPDLKTAGGEAYDIVCDDQYVGAMALVFRENDRLTGSVQLEQDAVRGRDKEEMMSFLQRHIQSLADALNVVSCDVIVTFADYDRIIERMDEDYDAEWVEDESLLTDIDPQQRDEIEMEVVRDIGDIEDEEETYYQLVMMHEEEDRREYRVYDQDRQLIAEAVLILREDDVSGTVEWMDEPGDEELDAVTGLIVDSFDEREISTFRLAMVIDGDLIDAIELKHQDLLEEQPFFEAADERSDYSIVLVRDDEDVLTYEIYQQSRGGLPIGTATVDIGQRQLTGFIDFREPGTPDDREQIAALLLEELDKEWEYDSFNVSMMVKNRLIDEILFETERFH